MSHLCLCMCMCMCACTRYLDIRVIGYSPTRRSHFAIARRYRLGKPWPDAQQRRVVVFSVGSNNFATSWPSGEKYHVHDYRVNNCISEACHAMVKDAATSAARDTPCRSLATTRRHTRSCEIRISSLWYVPYVSTILHLSSDEVREFVRVRVRLARFMSRIPRDPSSGRRIPLKDVSKSPRPVSIVIT